MSTFKTYTHVLSLSDVAPVLVHMPATLDPEDPRRSDLSVLKWSGDEKIPPARGSVVHVRINRIGKATVTGYFYEGGWFGLLVKPHSPPEWYVRQNGANATCHVYGIEVE